MGLGEKDKADLRRTVRGLRHHAAGIEAAVKAECDRLEEELFRAMDDEAVNLPESPMKQPGTDETWEDVAEAQHAEIVDLKWQLRLYERRFCNCGKPDNSEYHHRDCAVPISNGDPWTPPPWAT